MTRPGCWKPKAIPCPAAASPTPLGLVLWSAKPGFVDDQGEVLKRGLQASGDYQSQDCALWAAAVAADPTGFARRPPAQVRHWREYFPGLSIRGDGERRLGFIAPSQVMADGQLSGGSIWIVPADLHEPIRRDAAILAKGRNQPAAPRWSNTSKGTRPQPSSSLTVMLCDVIETALVPALSHGGGFCHGFREHRRMLSEANVAAVWLTLKLATITTVILLIVGTPHRLVAGPDPLKMERRYRCGGGLAAGVATHRPGFLLVDDPGTARADRSTHPVPGMGRIAFYLRRVGGGLGILFDALRGAALAAGVRGDRRATAGGGGRCEPNQSLGCLFTVVLPLAKPGFITASILGFAHTVGEFGVVLMIGGNIPEKTQWYRCKSTITSKRWNMPRRMCWPAACCCSVFWCCWLFTPAGDKRLK